LHQKVVQVKAFARLDLFGESLRCGNVHALLHFFYQRHGASQYQEVLATPFILWGQGVPAGMRVQQAVENIDLFPTLLELANLADPGSLHGRSLVPLMSSSGAAGPEFVFSYGVHGNAVREVDSGWKLILPRGNALRAGHGPRLFDLNADPHERENRAAEQPHVVERLVRAWRDWRTAYPTDDNLSSAMSRRADREQRRVLRALGYTDLDVGGEDDGEQ
jgi:arylsulfatase A-like enzyme